MLVSNMVKCIMQSTWPGEGRVLLRWGVQGSGRLRNEQACHPERNEVESKDLRTFWGAEGNWGCEDPSTRVARSG